MLGRPQWTTVIVTGLLQAAVTISVFAWALDVAGLDEARNLAFSVIVFSELFRSFAARSTTRLFWEVGRSPTCVSWASSSSRAWSNWVFTTSPLPRPSSVPVPFPHRIAPWRSRWG